MKKSMILLGAFAVLLAAPSFAQEKTESKLKTLEVAPAKVEKVEKLETEKVRSSNEALELKTIEKSEEKVEPKVYKRKPMRKVEPVESRELKSTVPATKVEKE